MTGGVMFGPKHDIAVLKEWTEDRILDADKNERDFRAYIYFHEFLLFSEPTATRTIEGCSFSQKGNRVLLVVKSIDAGIPQVAYVTERDTRNCVVTFGRMWLEGRVVWHPDKYKQI